MKSKFSIFFLFFTAICFVMSSLEVNTEYVSNTFGDQYDNYIQQDCDKEYVSVNVVQDIVPYCFVLSNSHLFSNHISEGSLSISCRTISSGEKSVRKYILNRVLII